MISELGDPIRLAAGYTGRPLALIGPAAYPSWRRLLTLLLAIVVPIVAILAGVGAVIDDDSLGTVLGTVWVAAITTAVHLAVWVTVVYAVLERAGVFDKDAGGTHRRRGVDPGAAAGARGRSAGRPRRDHRLRCSGARS